MKPQFLFLFLLFSCTQLPVKKKLELTSSPDLEKLWVQNGCYLYTNKKNLKSYPGMYCVFLPDGSFLSANEQSLKKISPKQEVLWEVPGHYHHQLNLSPDGQRIYALSSEVVVRNKIAERDDVLMILDLNGKILRRVNSTTIVRSVGGEPLNWYKPVELAVVKATIETTHFNSFYEIPENAYSATVPWMKAGNLIVNSIKLGIFVLSPDLSHVLSHHLIPHENQLHDVQVTPDGNFLIFNNWAQSTDGNRFSAIQKYDPVTKKITTLFEASPKETFYSPACGGVQELGDLIFFNHITGGGFIWSVPEQKLIKSFQGYNGKRQALTPMQQLKLVDVGEFFKNSK
ncbi:MAG: hypothetical protein ACJ76H_04555 [Bacteriovoracaceae bacterium]